MKKYGLFLLLVVAVSFFLFDGKMNNDSFLVSLYSSLNPKKSKLRQTKVKPEIILKTDKGVLSYVYQNETVLCDGEVSAGCTNSVLSMEPLRIDFSQRNGIEKIYLTLGIQNLWVEISTKYKKGTCMFDVVMKHEQSHVAYARNALERYSLKMAKAVLLKAASMPKTVDGNEALRQLNEIAAQYFKMMKEEKTRQDDLIDYKGKNSYRWDECRA